MNIYFVGFDDYETLDLMGPVEFLARLPDVQLHYISLNGGWITSRQGFCIQTETCGRLPPNSILVIPGGQGTRLLVNHCAFLAWLTKLIDDARFCLSICTGAALVAATFRLNGKTATSNKAAFQWVKQTNNQVNWQQTARWVRDGKFYSSSGVSAGMDMVLGFIGDQYGESLATQIAIYTEYHWNQDPNKDDFAARYC